MQYYAIVNNSKILFRYPLNSTTEFLQYCLACARDRFGANVELEHHTPADTGLECQIVNI